jgi:hypothetical protein
VTNLTFEFIRRPISPILSPSSRTFVELALVNRRIRPAPSNRLEGWQARHRKHNRSRGSYDDQRNLDAAILGIHDKKTLPEDTVEAKRIIRRSKAFVMLQGKLYKKSITGVLQRCVTPQEGEDILRDIHAGVCGHHASSRAIAAKAFRAGFYWLTAIEDAKEIVRRCEACQRFASRPHATAADLQPIPLSLPFAQ